MNDIERERWYKELTYADAKDILREKLMNLKMNFIAAGYYLKYIRDNELYLEDGYTSIWDFAEDNYGIQKSTASRWMKMNDRFSEGGNTPILAEKYKAFGKSQLQEMLYLEDDQMDQVTPDMTVKEIREVRNPEPEEEPVSVLGYPLRIYPEDSLLKTPGCGKQDCYSCHRDGCELRQVDCYCVEAPMGNPFPCTTLNVVDNLRKDIGNRCQFVNSDLADERVGDGQPVPCCKRCNNPCGYECNRSIKSRCKDVCESVATSQQVNDHMIVDLDEQIPGQMSVEDFPEILPKREDADVSNDSVSIDELNLSVRTYNVLKRAGIETIEQIQEMSDVDLAMIRNFSKRCMDEVHSKLEEYAKNNSENPVHDIAQDETESVIDTEYKEIAAESTETEEICCQKAADLDELAFSQVAIRDYLEEEERTLAEYEKVNSEDGGLPLNLMMRQRMLVKGLRLLMEHEADQDDQEEDDEHEEIEPVQPELPVLKNNDQRKEWLKDYRSWGLWYRDENIDVNYYKYDFSDGSRLVVAEYPMREGYWNREPEDEHYFHLLEKNKKKYASINEVYDEKFRNQTNSETYLMEFLKNLQKGEKK